MFTFIAQTIWVVFVWLESEGKLIGFGVVVSPTTMIYGITPTIVLVRAAMGRSYDTTVIQSAIEFTLSDNGGQAHNSVTNASFDQSHQTINLTRSTQSDQDAEKRVF